MFLVYADDHTKGTVDFIPFTPGEIVTPAPGSTGTLPRQGHVCRHEVAFLTVNSEEDISGAPEPPDVLIKTPPKTVAGASAAPPRQSPS